MNLYLQGFINATHDWCQQRANSFKYYWPLKGGWEAWVQADLAAYILSRDTTIDILREQPIYTNNRQRVDWLFNDNATEIEKLAVELKCQSFDNRNAFISGLQDDIAKLQYNRKNGYRNCQAVAMGICFESNARNWMLNNGFLEVYEDGEISCCILKLN